MQRNHAKDQCPDCEDVSRRQFMSAAVGASLAVSALPVLGGTAAAAPSRDSKAETAVRRLFDSLSDDQKKVVALSLDDERRKKVSANWSVTKAAIGSFFDKDQQETIREIVRGVTSEDGYERLMRQMDEDWGGFQKYAVALFGNPHEKQFEFELTGRHLTLRADGNTLKGVAFGGPLVYGHAKSGNSNDNLFWYQTEQVNEVYKMLDGKQQRKALLPTAPRENAVQLRDDVKAVPGIAGRELSEDQKEQLSKSLQAVMQIYREEDVKEVMEILEAGGGLDALHLSFYQNRDLGDDGVWDVWRLEGPTVVCHFRGAPHVHAYINVARRG